MTYWAKTNWIDIDTVVFLVNISIKEMINTKLNPGEAVVMHKSA